MNHCLGIQSHSIFPRLIPWLGLWTQITDLCHVGQYSSTYSTFRKWDTSHWGHLYKKLLSPCKHFSLRSRHGSRTSYNNQNTFPDKHLLHGSRHRSYYPLSKILFPKSTSYMGQVTGHGIYLNDSFILIQLYIRFRLVTSTNRGHSRIRDYSHQS